MKTLIATLAIAGFSVSAALACPMQKSVEAHDMMSTASIKAPVSEPVDTADAEKAMSDAKGVAKEPVADQD